MRCCGLIQCFVRLLPSISNRNNALTLKKHNNNANYSSKPTTYSGLCPQLRTTLVWVKIQNLGMEIIFDHQILDWSSNLIPASHLDPSYMHANGSFLSSVSCLGETERSERWDQEVGPGDRLRLRWGTDRSQSVPIDPSKVLKDVHFHPLTTTRTISLKSVVLPTVLRRSVEGPIVPSDLNKTMSFAFE